MSCEDVIELGSSDEEAEPARKKSKPMPNAMVCIPSKFHDVTITPATPNPITIAKGLGKAITVKKVVSNKSQNVTKSKFINGMPAQEAKPRFGVNPLAGRPKLIMAQNKPSYSIVPILRPGNPKSVVMKPSALLQPPIKIQKSGPLNLLPPSITVKKTISNRPIVMLNVKNKKDLNQRGVSNVLTVDLDDDETPARRSSPQWYVRPEDQLETSNLEEENNKEPEESKLIEITIEDSPIKPIINKPTHAVGAELAITIDDSPVKAVVDKNKPTSDTDNESDNSGRRTPQSKKQLVYPKDTDDKKTVEIEVDAPAASVNNTTDFKNEENDSIVSPLADSKQNSNNNPNVESIVDKSIEEKCEMSSSKEVETHKSDLNEFHPVYQSFIDLCFQLENSEDMKTIVEKKIKGYYKQVPIEYTESEEFTDMVSGKMLSMKASPAKMFLYIKDIVDELNLQRKLAKAQPIVKEKKNEEAEQVYKGESEYDSKRQRQIRKLEKTIKKLHRAIQKLEQQEVDFDDEDDSVYLLTERYKERMVRVYAKFCQLSNTKMPSEPRIQIDARPGQPTGPAKRLEKWINKKVPIGTPLPFPDFHDVVRCVREANEEDRLNFNEFDIMEEARDLFTRCGKKLQRRRQENEWRLAASRITQDVDPEENNEELKQKLNENQKVAAQKETEIFNRYADRQKQLKLEAEEIGDREAEESPVESEEEEMNDSVSLENTEKRKERLKRLLHEKSKKNVEEKDSQPLNEDEKNEVEEHKVEKNKNEKDEIEQNEFQKNERERNEFEEKILKKDELENNEVEKNDVDKKEEEASETATEVDRVSTGEPKYEEVDNKDVDDIKENKEVNNQEEKPVQHATETLTLSDDSNRLESDIDELHLLQKLHSGNEDHSSCIDSSDSDSPIAISDSLESSDNSKKEVDDDVISIENSSYSENEAHKVEDFQAIGNVQLINEDSSPTQDNEGACAIDENAMDVDLNCDELQNPIIKAPAQTNNDEYTEAVEDILLASSDDSNNCDSQEEITESACVNLRDDLISIDETVIGHVASETNIEDMQEPGISSVEAEAENSIFEVNIDINVMTTNNTRADIQTANPESNITQADIIETVDEERRIVNVSLDEAPKTVEIMDIDEDDSLINETEILDSPDQNIPTTSSVKES